MGVGGGGLILDSGEDPSLNHTVILELKLQE